MDILLLQIDTVVEGPTVPAAGYRVPGPLTSTNLAGCFWTSPEPGGVTGRGDKSGQFLLQLDRLCRRLRASIFVFPSQTCGRSARGSAVIQFGGIRRCFLWDAIGRLCRGPLPVSLEERRMRQILELSKLSTC